MWSRTRDLQGDMVLISSFVQIACGTPPTKTFQSNSGQFNRSPNLFEVAFEAAF